MPSTGNSTSGSIDVMGSGSASDTQKIVINKTTYMQRNSYKHAQNKTGCQRTPTVA